MPLHFSNPDDAELECPGCVRCGPPIAVKADEGCNGTGRINVGAKADIDVSEFFMDGKSIGWFWESPPNDGQLCGNPSGHNEVQAFETEALALAAARTALRGTG